MKSLAIKFYNLVYRIFSGSGLYKITFVKKANKKILGLIRQKTVVVNGLTLNLDKKDSLNLSVNKNYEPAETAFLKATIKKGDKVQLPPPVEPLNSKPKKKAPKKKGGKRGRPGTETKKKVYRKKDQ